MYAASEISDPANGFLYFTFSLQLKATTVLLGPHTVCEMLALPEIGRKVICIALPVLAGECSTTAVKGER